MNRSRFPLYEKQRLPTRRVRRSFTFRTPEPVSTTARWMGRGETVRKRWTWPLRGLSRRARGAVRSPAAPATPGAGAAAVPPPTRRALERIAPGFVALRRCTPVAVNITAALPAASVVAPPTAAPAMGAPVRWSTTRTAAGTPAVAIAGRVGRRGGIDPGPYA